MKDITTFKLLLKLRRAIRANQYCGMTIRKSTYGNGWEIGHISTQWTLWTIYVDQACGFSLFRAIPDIWKGIDIWDEKLVIQRPEIVLVMNFWHSEWHQFQYGPPQTKARDTWEGKMLQKF